MKDYGFLELLLARPPSRLVRFPEMPLEKALSELQALKDRVAQEPVPAAPAAVAPATGNDAIDDALAALATNVWRTQGKMVDPATGEPREETRRIYRHVEGALEAFAQMDVRLSDWVGQPYDAGLPVKVLSFQPSPDISRDTVIEAVRPAVFWRDRLLQVGEVVVGTPPSTNPPAT